ncbi:hypothetical protein [Spirabiliibacterium falconis]|uniref:hypothetical protein n=1 Tax=Spirabiliibacterium falconis TaxID=572023 RepID=UPI001AAE0C59|nr:hypothetical protein [Spirabiliibacterium falconis]MBE2895189.1 hypothetical protein [Spirabiliibacterium falconis]
MNIYKKVALGLSIVFSVVPPYFIGDRITFSDQWPLYESLRTTAAIIFAVVGAWFAIVYPEKLKSPFKGGIIDNQSSDARFRALFSPIVHSTAILCIILFIGILAPIMKQIPALLEYKNYMRAISFGFLCILTFWQIWTVFITLIPADIIKNQAEIEKNRQKNIDHLMSKTKQE